MIFDLSRYKDALKRLNAQKEQSTVFYPLGDGDVTIPIVLQDIDQLYNPLAPEEYPEPSAEVMDRINTAITYIPIARTLNISLDVRQPLTEGQKTRASNMLRNWFGVSARIQIRERHVMSLRIITLLACGVIFLLFSYMMATLTEIDHVFYDTVNICATFMIWEAADELLLERSALTFQITNRMRLYTSTISFKEQQTKA